MVTRVLSGNIAIEEGAKLIKDGQVVAFPTETVYGLGGNALDPMSIAKIYQAKGRPSDNPLIVHVASVEDIYPLVSEFSDVNRRLVDAFMPGAITLLFPKSELVPLEVTAGLNTVGIRIPSLDIARDFIAECGVPIAAPSANASTRVSPTTASHVFEDMNGRIPLIIDGGECEVGIESTVLDLTAAIPTILRPGAITAEMLVNVLGEVKTHEGEVITSAPSPGMKYKHYATSVPMVIAESIESLINEYDLRAEEGLDVVALVRAEQVASIEGRRCIDIGANDTEVCKNIYKVMRDVEKVSEYIICIYLGNEGVCSSVMNRLIKSVGGKVV